MTWLEKLYVLGLMVAFFVLALFGSEKANAGHLGTAWALNKQGYYATAYHVVQGMKSFEAVLDTDYPVPLTLVAVDPVHDEAILYGNLHAGYSFVLKPMYIMGQQAILYGYPDPPKYHYHIATVTGAFFAASYRFEQEINFNSSTIEGESGGVITDTCGYAVGSLWGGNSQMSYGPSTRYLIDLAQKNNIEINYVGQCRQLNQQYLHDTNAVIVVFGE